MKQDRYEKTQLTCEDEQLYPMIIRGLPKELVLHMTTFLNKKLDQELYDIDLQSRKLSICKSIMFLNNVHKEHDNSFNVL